jgi:hypothetical protein
LYLIIFCFVKDSLEIISRRNSFDERRQHLWLSSYAPLGLRAVAGELAVAGKFLFFVQIFFKTF